LRVCWLVDREDQADWDRLFGRLLIDVLKRCKSQKKPTTVDVTHQFPAVETLPYQNQFREYVPPLASQQVALHALQAAKKLVRVGTWRPRGRQLLTDCSAIAPVRAMGKREVTRRLALGESTS
jgi:hypothetical protein